jgi:hypothetical protein
VCVDNMPRRGLRGVPAENAIRGDENGEIDGLV